MKAQMSKIVSSLLLCGAVTATGAAELDIAKIDSITGLKGKLNSEEGVYKVSQPRTDLKITVDQWEMPPFMGLTSWAAFQAGAQKNAMVMGDLVLMQDEVNPVMSALLDSGLEVTALHNHFFWENPRIYYMHLHGHGKASDLAERIKPPLMLIGKDEPPPPASSATPKSSLDTAQIAKIVGHDGEQNGAVYKITVGRDDLKLQEMGALINSRMGLNTWAAFYGSNEDAAIAGDVAMLESEVTPTLKALRSHGLDVVAIHHHMIETQPVIIFLHYWGRGPSSQLAQGFKAALDQLGKGGKYMSPR